MTHLPTPLDDETVAKTRLYLDNIPLLFQNTLEWRPEFADVKPEYVLAWIAKAWMDVLKVEPSYKINPRMYGLRDPIGFIISRIASRPNQWLVEHVVERLPDNYLEAIGLLTFACEECDFTTRIRAEMTAHIEAAHPPEPIQEEASPAENMQPDETVTASVRTVWQGVLETLRGEMPRASFETWVRETIPAHVDNAGWMIGARNGYARDWLEMRMTGVIERILGRSVRFVVAVETEE